MLGEARLQLSALNKELLQERTKGMMKGAMMAKVKNKKGGNSIETMAKINKLVKEMDALKEENAEMILKLNSQKDYNKLKLYARRRLVVCRLPPTMPVCTYCTDDYARCTYACMHVIVQRIYFITRFISFIYY